MTKKNNHYLTTTPKTRIKCTKLRTQTPSKFVIPPSPVKTLSYAGVLMYYTTRSIMYVNGIRNAVHVAYQIMMVGLFLCHENL